MPVEREGEEQVVLVSEIERRHRPALRVHGDDAHPGAEEHQRRFLQQQGAQAIALHSLASFACSLGGASHPRRKSSPSCATSFRRIASAVLALLTASAARKYVARYSTAGTPMANASESMRNRDAASDAFADAANRAWKYSGASAAAPSAYPVIDGKWHHIVAVCRRLPLQAPAMYVDGELRIHRVE